MAQSGKVPAGGLSSPIYHCIFNQGSLTHFLHEVDPSVVDQLPHMYAVCVAGRVNGKRNVVAGFVLKTSYSHQDPGFDGACKGAISCMKEIAPLLDSTTTLLPARIAVDGTNQSPLTEDEMNAFMFTQYMKFHEIGQA